MPTTPPSLLAKVRATGDQKAWQEFVDLYSPLLFHWARRFTDQDQDAADLVQDVFTTLIRKLPEFDYDQSKSFRSWLRTVLLNQMRNNRRCRARQALGGDPDALGEVPAVDAFGEADEAEYRRYLATRALKLMEVQFQPTTWRACWETVVTGRPAAEVARDLGLSENAVYIAKYRVLSRLRQELDGLLD